MPINKKSLANLSLIKKGEKRAEKPVSEHRKERLVIMATKAERLQIEQSAKEAGKNMSSYMREKLGLTKKVK